MQKIEPLHQLFLLLLEQLAAPLEPGLRGLQPLHVACRHVQQVQLRHLLVLGQLGDETLQVLELVPQLDATLTLHRVVDLAIDLLLAIPEVRDELAQGRCRRRRWLRLEQRTNGAHRLVVLVTAGAVAGPCAQLMVLFLDQGSTDKRVFGVLDMSAR